MLLNAILGVQHVKKSYSSNTMCLKCDFVFSVIQPISIVTPILLDNRKAISESVNLEWPQETLNSLSQFGVSLVTFHSSP